jgi:hypothetical protein
MLKRTEARANLDSSNQEQLAAISSPYGGLVHLNLLPV